MELREKVRGSRVPREAVTSAPGAFASRIVDVGEATIGQLVPDQELRRLARRVAQFALGRVWIATGGETPSTSMRSALNLNTDACCARGPRPRGAHVQAPQRRDSCPRRSPDSGIGVTTPRSSIPKARRSSGVSTARCPSSFGKDPIPQRDDRERGDQVRHECQRCITERQRKDRVQLAGQRGLSGGTRANASAVARTSASSEPARDTSQTTRPLLQSVSVTSPRHDPDPPAGAAGRARDCASA